MAIEDPRLVLKVFLLTDIVGSTGMWRDHPQDMARALTRHDALLTEAVQRCGGRIVRTKGEGDSVFAVFDRAGDAVRGAIEIRTAISEEPWPKNTPITLRMGIHGGEVDPREGDYFGTAVNFTARLRAIAHPGQIVVSEAMKVMCDQSVDPPCAWRPLGDVRIRDFGLQTLFEPDDPHFVFEPLDLSAPSHNLPERLSSFVGRSEDLQNLREKLETRRLVSLVGVAGSGKTRLMEEAARRMTDLYPDGVRMVELGDCRDPERIPAKVGAACGLREGDGREMPELIAEYFSSRCALLLIDDCEHLLEPCGEFVEDALRRHEGLSVLTTSQVPLKISGETTHRVYPLPYPDPSKVRTVEDLLAFDATALFLERARETDTRFHPAGAEIRAIAEICRRLDGIPLAIELAAARVPGLGVMEVARKIEIHLESHGLEEELPGHRMLEEALRWSYEMLPEKDARVWRRLFVFDGGFQIEAAQAVCRLEEADPTDIGESLAELVDRSLLLREGSDAPRYRMLETLRSLAGRLARDRSEADAVRDKHARYFAAVATGRPARGQGSDDHLAALYRDQDNLHRALKRLIAREETAEVAAEMIVALEPFWRHFGELVEGLRWFEQADILNVPEGLRTRLWNGRGVLSWQLGRLQDARRFYERALEGFESVQDVQSKARALSNLGLVEWQELRLEEANGRFLEALALHEGLDDPVGRGNVLNNLGILEWRRGNLSNSKRWHREALKARESVGDKAQVAASYVNMALVLTDEGELESARKLTERAQELFVQLGNRADAATCLHNLGDLAWKAGDLDRAWAMAEECEAIYADIGDEAGLAFAALLKAHVESGRGESAAAIEHCRRAIDLAAEHGHEHVLMESLEALIPNLVSMGRTRIAGDACRYLARVGQIEAAVVYGKFGLDPTEHGQSGDEGDLGVLLFDLEFL